MSGRRTRTLTHTDPDEVPLQAALEALADPVRRSILRQLAASPDWTRACGMFDLGVTKATGSHHFAVLRKAGLIEQRDDGPRSSTGAFPGCCASFSRTAEAPGTFASAVTFRTRFTVVHGGAAVLTAHGERGPGMHVQESETAAPEKAAKYLRVKVVDHDKDNHPAVNIKVPIGVVKWGMKMAQAFSPQLKDVDLDWDAIDAMIQEGESGKIVEVEDEAEHKTVEVWLE